MTTLSEQLIEENPILKAARANQSPAPEVSAPANVTPGRSTIDSTSQTISVSKSVVGESAEGITTDSVIADITSGIEQANELSREKQASLQAASENMTAAEKAVMSEATNNAIIQRQEDTANIDADIKTNEAWKAAGDVETYSKLATKMKTSSEAMLAKQKIVSDMVNDDTIGGFFTRLFFLGDAVEEANVAEVSFNKVDRVLDNMAAFAPQTEKAMDAVRTLDTVATRDAHGKQILAAATVQSSQWGAEAQKLNAERVQTAMRMTQAESEAQIQKWSLLAQRETMKSTAAARKLLADKAAKDRRVMETWIDGVILGEKRGGQKEDLSQTHRDNIEAQITAGGEMQERMMDKFILGIGRADPTPYQSFNSISLDNDNSLIDGSNPAKASYQESWNKLVHASKGSPNDQGILTTKPFKLDSALASDMFNEINTTDRANYAARIEEGDIKNPNQAIPLSSLVEAPAVKDLKPVVNVLKPLLTGDTKDLTPTHVFQLVMSGVKTKGNKEGTYTFVEAMEAVKAIYTKAATHNTEAQKRILYNIPIQDSYNAKFEVGKLLEQEGLEDNERHAIAQVINTLGVINLMDETLLTNAGLRYISAKEPGNVRFRSLAVEAGGGFFGRGEPIEGRPDATQELLNKINGQEGLK